MELIAHNCITNCIFLLIPEIQKQFLMAVFLDTIGLPW